MQLIIQTKVQDHKSVRTYIFQKMISCIEVTQFQNLSRLQAADYSDKSSRPLDCTNVHIPENDKFYLG